MIWHDKSIEYILKELNTNKASGLFDNEIKKRLSKYGKNLIVSKKPPGFLKKFFDQFNDFMIIVLLLAALVSFVVSLMNSDPDFIDPIIILFIVVFNALIGVIQENRAEKSIEALKKQTSPTATVKRNNSQFTIPAENLVPGDILVLKSGDRVPADCRLIKSVLLFVDESSLTGESVLIEKTADCICPETSPLAERKNMVWSGSMVVEGKAEAIVCSTGMSTQIGNIASLIISSEDKKTPLAEKLSDIGKTLGIGALVICGIVFLMGVFMKLPIFDMFMTSVSLAVAAIPEGLPAIVTIILAIGVVRMSRLGAIIKNLSSVETLGCASVICSDKTGTLTQNKMTVTRVVSHDDKKTLFCALLASDDESENPTEKAILSYADEIGLSKKELDKLYERISEIPFNSKRKKMSVLCKNKNSFISCTKGAPDVVLELCTHYYKDSKKIFLTPDLKKEILKNNESLASDALRVIAIAFFEKDNLEVPCEKGLVFSGLIAIEDPPRPEVFDAVRICKDAHITPVMITGDHLITAKAIAKRVGILDDEKLAMSGVELDRLSQRELEEKIDKYSVFARVSPEHKMRIVKAWQKKKAIVAMTGDGVNDAPALKCSDIGCSMGIAGTDVAKSASDMILTDDNFATIVSAIKQGRGIFENIKKTTRFLLSSNIGEILTVFLGLLFTGATPLIAIQLLWVNLVTDSLPAIALGLEATEENVMSMPPRSADKSIFSDGLGVSIFLEGALIGALALLGYVIGNIFFAPDIGRTFAFCILSLSQLVHSFNARSEKSVFRIGVFKNKYLCLAFVAGFLLQYAVVQIPLFASLFKITPLSFLQWIIVIGLSFVPLLVLEIQKFFSFLFHRN